MNNALKASSNDKIISKLFFRLLPVQILLVGIPSLNGIISSLFASNMLGEDAMTAIGMYAPIVQFITAISNVFLGGSQILCGKYMGGNQVERTQEIFSLNITAVSITAVIASVLMAAAGAFQMTGFMNPDPGVIAMFNRYLIGCAIGLLPMMLGSQLSAFLSLELEGSRSTIATALFVVTNLVLTWLFVGVLHMQAFGLALAASIGYWVYLTVELLYYFSGKSLLKLKMVKFRMPDLSDIILIGFPGATTALYLTIRRFVLNGMITRYVGNAGMSAFTASDTLLAIFWALPLGMANVCRMLMSVSYGEEDRQSLKDVFKTMVGRCLLIQLAMMAVLILLAVPFTRFFIRDVSDPVYQMTVTAFRLLPLTMPLGLVCQTWLNYGQVSRKQVLTHSLALIDGVLCPCLAMLALVPALGMNGVYYAMIINGIVTVIYPMIYSIVVNRGIPKNLDRLLMIPNSFGAPEEDRLDISLHSDEEVVNIAEQVQRFCTEKGLEERKAYLSGLFLEEMAGNIVDHGFTKDKKEHSVDVRVVCKDGDVILRLKDDCIPFDPKQRASIADPEDITKNFGIRMVYSMAKDISYQNILGLNVLTIRIP